MPEREGMTEQIIAYRFYILQSKFTHLSQQPWLRGTGALRH